ncbi:8116_t:CDS:2, partial [Racocetra fulgida]
VNKLEIQSNLIQKINNLKLELLNKEKTLIAYKYNQKFTIYKYLIRLNKNNTNQAAREYWLENNCLPKSQQGKHKKIKSLNNNEDFIKKYHEWILSQNGITCSLKSKKFVKDECLKNLDKKNYLYTNNIPM